jgi:indolepyruvate ferredoxin oxidoreductase beta subunit
MSDVVIAGVGGQGTVLASKLLARAALLERREIRTAETIGMAQRGGSVLGHIRIGADAVTTFAPLSPLVPLGHADMLIGFEPGETVRALGYLREGGTVVTAREALKPVTAALGAASYDGNAECAYLRACEKSGRIGRLTVVDGAAACAALGSTRVLNVVLLGAALATKSLDLPVSAVQEALEALIKPSYIELNRAALAKGMEDRDT